MKEGSYLLQHTKKIYTRELSKMKDIFLVSAECEEFRVYCISDRASMLLSWIENFRGGNSLWMGGTQTFSGRDSNTVPVQIKVGALSSALTLAISFYSMGTAQTQTVVPTTHIT